MRILVTGGFGFLGQVVVQTLITSNYIARVIVRPGKDIHQLPWQDPRVEIVEADLVDLPENSAIMQGVDGVIHLAASKSSDFETAYRNTISATKNLLSIMERSQVWRLIGISSFSVYDYDGISQGHCLNETISLDRRPELRDVYARTKIIQETLFHQFSNLPQSAVTILRPGMIYGPGYLWNTCQGVSVGPAWLLIGPSAQMPLTYVENCAEAIVASLTSEDSIGKTVNIVDDDLPTRQSYTEALIQGGTWQPKVIAISWDVVYCLAQIVWSTHQTLLKSRGHLPGLMMPARLNARLKPLTYSNAQAKAVLHWQPQYTWQEALARCFAASSR